MRLLRTGSLIWLAATIALRLAGQYLLHPGRALATLILFAATLPLMAAVARLATSHLRREERLTGAVSLVLPTLLLDPFSSAFFPAVFPNIAPEAAGLFGGWMLCCCAGALLGGIKPA